MLIEQCANLREEHLHEQSDCIQDKCGDEDYVLLVDIRSIGNVSSLPQTCTFIEVSSELSIASSPQPGTRQSRREQQLQLSRGNS